MSLISPETKRLFSQSCQFIAGAQNVSSLPFLSLPAFAFIGRSNVGKSSLINGLVNQKKLVRTSSDPGCTKQINFFQLSTKLLLVDVPGYGFARTSKATQARWKNLIEYYLQHSNNLRRAFILVDSRHPLKESDQEMMAYLDSIPVSYQIIFTKSDLSPASQIKAHHDFISEIAPKHPALFVQSIVASSKKMQGIDDLRDTIYNLL